MISPQKQLIFSVIFKSNVCLNSISLKNIKISLKMDLYAKLFQRVWRTLKNRPSNDVTSQSMYEVILPATWELYATPTPQMLLSLAAETSPAQRVPWLKQKRHTQCVLLVKYKHHLINVQICIENLFYRRFILCAFLVEMQSYQPNKLPQLRIPKKRFFGIKNFLKNIFVQQTIFRWDIKKDVHSMIIHLTFIWIILNC